MPLILLTTECCVACICGGFFQILILFFVFLTFSIMFKSMYKYSCLSIHAEAWLWYWGQCLPYEKVSIRFQINLFPWNHSFPVLGDNNEYENSDIQIRGMFLIQPDWPLYSNLPELRLVCFSCSFLLVDYWRSNSPYSFSLICVGKEQDTGKGLLCTKQDSQ